MPIRIWKSISRKLEEIVREENKNNIQAVVLFHNLLIRFTLDSFEFVIWSKTKASSDFVVS